jgi:2-amino-4-hydroxy-6-hydroxymethyldihydropteridine diphosphokinase
MSVCYVALGGNVGDVEAAIERALALLHAPPTLSVESRSRAYRTVPVGSNAGPSDFLNAAARLETTLSPRELLERLLAVERELGRTREVHWGPRTIDVDLIYYDGAVIDEDGLRIPHPRAWQRRFVLDPLCEIAAEFVDPERQLSVAALRDRLMVRPLPVHLSGGVRNLAPDLGRLDPDLAAKVEFRRGPPETDAALHIWSRDSEDTTDFESLPAESRLDLSDAPNLLKALRDVLRSAVGS